MKEQRQEMGIGKLIFELRVQRNLSEEAVSNGLCSISEFRRIEAGEKLANKTLLDALLGRMGCASDNFSIILEKEQYELYHLRNQIQKAYLAKETEKLQRAMEQLKSKIGKEKGCNYQFYCKMRFLMGEYFHHTVDEMEKILIPIIQITIPQFALDKVLEFSLCEEEILLCCLLAAMYLKYKKKEKAKMLLEDLQISVEKSKWDIEEKVRVYPHIVILLFQVYDIWFENEKWLLIAQKASDLLAETGKIYLMEPLLESYQRGMEEKIQRRQRKFTILEKPIYQQISRGLESIQELKQEYGFSYERKEILLSSGEYNEIYLLPEIILDYRIRAKKSQIELGEALGVEWETISRYENGKNKPNRKNYALLSKEIGLPYNKYFMHLPIESYIVYEKIRQVERFLFRKEFILAEQLFLEIEPKIAKERAENRQYCIRTKAFLDFSFGRITLKEKLQQLEIAIQSTFPDYNAKNKYFLRHHIPRRYEVILLNNIATCYEKLGERETVIRILQAVLEAYRESEVKEEYYISNILLIIINYTECLGKQGDYKTALEEIENILKMELQFGKGSNLPYLIYAKGWNILKIEGSKITEEKRNACMKYYQQAYWISGLMNDFITQQNIEQIYEKDFGEKLV